MSSTPSSSAKRYPDVSPQPSYSKIEERIIAGWKERRTFERSLERHPLGASPEYVFYDGPPFANGLPHYGHLLTGFVKDTVPRFQTMRGKRVDRRFGWDCHGLPAEMEVEKESKISGRQQIQEYGIDKFNDLCRKSVMKYTSQWRSYVNRQARWVDLENDYKTMDLPYMESVIWAFKQLWQKGLVYEGYRVMPYSWACETPLSNFEIRLDNATRPRQDPAITVAFLLEPQGGETTKTSLLVWTTTPWTLPSNLGVAVGSDIDYAVMEQNGERFILAESAIERYQSQLAAAQQVGTLKGAELVGRRYQPLFPYFKDAANAFQVMAGEFVTTVDGTGIVHMAPGFGEDDQKLCEAHGINIVCPVDSRGCYTDEVPDLMGQQVFEANKVIIKMLKDRGVLVRHDTYNHNYPHCWRTDTPIIYRAVSSWYVRVTEFKDRMLQLNEQIRWIPDHIQHGQFGRFLENARDWSISRNRFWGAPIPVWRSDDPKYPRVDVYGSVAELERDFGVKVTDLHRPFVDNLVRPNPDDPTGKSMMRRVEEVLDCWFESGSMPFAQIHYPFENKQWFDNHFPADFIVEYIAQTRGWFYTMMILGTALFDRPPFKNCICHGVVLDENGQKLSKRLRNYPPPEEVFEKYGADALRWFLLSSPILRGLDLHIDREGKAIGEVTRSVLNPIWNAYYFFTLYANSDGITAQFSTGSRQLLDRYILSKTRELVEGVTEALENYDLAGACAQFGAFLEALNNWYIRRSRERFWKQEHDQEKIDAYNTLYTVLVTLTKVGAPLLPIVTEEIYGGLTGEESVHLTDWPDPVLFPSDPELVRAMDKVRDVCSVGLSLRENHNLRTRLPLASLTIAGKTAGALAPYAALIREELNVKAVHTAETIDRFATIQLQVNARELGPKLGAAMKDVLKATREGGWQIQPDGRAAIAGQLLEKEEYTLRLNPKAGVAAQSLSSNDAVVVLDVNVTPELEEEGTARDLVRLVQQARKEAGFHVADHIRLEVQLSEALRAVIARHEPYLKEQTLADSVAYALSQRGFRQEATLQGESVVIVVERQ